MKRVRKLKLTKDQEKEMEQRFQYKAEALQDFNSALSNCVTIEFNKRRVPGAEHSHWLEVVMTGGELVAVHLDALDALEKMILANAENQPKEKT